MNKLEIPSPAKLNLYLNVISKRKDGYHNILTVFERINLLDYISIEKIKKGIKIDSGNRDLPVGKANLAYKAARVFSKNLKCDLGVKIKISKNIPIGAGLGGGSSNAAEVLSGINKLYQTGIGKNVLLEWAGQIGSDVGFFLSGKSFAVGMGRGDVITPLDIDTKLWHILAYPGQPIYTRDIYNSSEIGLTREAPDVRILIKALKNNRIDSINKELFNSLEEAVEIKYGIVSACKRKLLLAGSKRVMVSGSGSSVFSILHDRKEANAIKGRMGRQGNTMIYVVSTY